MEKNELIKSICKAALNKKAEKVTVVNLDGMTVIADAFVICSAGSKTHVRAVCDNIEDEMKKQGVDAIREDGYDEARWVVLDYGDVIVHVFYEEERHFYDLERLWNNGSNMYLYTEE